MILDDNGDPEIKNKIMEMAQKFAEHQQQQTGRRKSLHPSKSLSCKEFKITPSFTKEFLEEGKDRGL